MFCSVNKCANILFMSFLVITKNEVSIMLQKNLVSQKADMATDYIDRFTYIYHSSLFTVDRLL